MRAVSLVFLALLPAVLANTLSSRTVSFGGSLATNVELIYTEQASTDSTCGLGFTQAVFGKSAIPLYVQENNAPLVQVEMGPVDLPSNLNDLPKYHLMFARLGATILPNFVAPGTSVPTLAQQVAQFQAIHAASSERDSLAPTLITITLGPNDIGGILTGVEAGVIPQAAVPTVLGEVITALVTQVVALHTQFPHAVIVVGNSPNIGDTPKFNFLPPTVLGLITSLTNFYNEALSVALESYSEKVVVWDLNAIIVTAVANGVGQFKTQACTSLCISSSSCVFADAFSASAATSAFAAADLTKLLKSFEHHL
jgi:hypothetical protein